MNDTQSYIINGTFHDKDRYNVHKCMRIALANADRCVRMRESNVVWRMWSMMVSGCGNGESVFRGVCRVGSVFGFVDCECEHLFMGRELRNREVPYGSSMGRDGGVMGRARVERAAETMSRDDAMRDDLDDSNIVMGTDSEIMRRKEWLGLEGDASRNEEINMTRCAESRYMRDSRYEMGEDVYQGMKVAMNDREMYHEQYQDRGTAYKPVSYQYPRYYDTKSGTAPTDLPYTHPYSYDEYTAPYDTYKQYAYNQTRYANENYANYPDEYVYKDECANTEECNGYYYEKGSDYSYESKKEYKNQECAHCGTRVTSLWRKLHGETVCNACGLYYKIHGIRRPETLKGNKVRRRRRIPKKKGHYESV
ncbi:GATA-4/5/6 transcription factor [Trachipleistophora hominis]|uniref:GATA-4/5/6 transcription factor n=1 Tax=Trachipleistophora hominis TaxID=72359 RepID=L7JR22_TRAHO|nr:GATA-4/5/6 transcription factor [Trachipleistophora hominis]